MEGTYFLDTFAENPASVKHVRDEGVPWRAPKPLALRTFFSGPFGSLFSSGLFECLPTYQSLAAGNHRASLRNGFLRVLFFRFSPLLPPRPFWIAETRALFLCVSAQECFFYTVANRSLGWNAWRRERYCRGRKTVLELKLTWDESTGLFCRNSPWIL